MAEEKKAEEQKPEEKKPEEKKAPEKKAEAKPAAEVKAKESAKPKEEAKPGEAKKRKLVKGRHASAIKRHRQSLKRAARNQTAFSSLKTSMKKVRQAVLSKDGKAAGELLKAAMSSLHKAASRGIIHPRNASRHIARLSSLVNSAA